MSPVEAMAAVTSVMRAQQLLLANLNELLRPFGLTFARYEALILLSFATDGSLPLGKIGERLQVHPTSVTNIIDRLEQQGLVRRIPHESDRRATLAVLTPKGRRLADRATKVMHETEFAVVGLSSAELDTITELITQLRQASGDFLEH